MNPWFRQLVYQPVIIPLQRKGARLLMKAALFVVAVVNFLVALAFLTVAFFIWIDGLAGPLIAALAVAGLYLGVGIVACLVALYAGNETPAAASKPSAAQSGPRAERHSDAGRMAEETDPRAEITEAVLPFLEIMRGLGLKKEEMALLAGAELAKKLPPLTLVAFALICGFLLGRMGKIPFGLNPKPPA